MSGDFRPSAHAMERYKLILAYDGSAFAGSQRQAKSRTVQGELEKALSQLGWRETSILLAGRTDSGVHASGQVASCKLNWPHSPEALQKALNALLPPDMAVQDVEVIQDQFHPRFDARSRRYEYRLFCQPVRDPLQERFSWRVWPGVDGETLKQVAGRLVGCYDFAAFGSPPRAESSTVRTVTLAEWRQEHDAWLFTVEADAFLYRMVRRMTFLQVVVAQGKLPASALSDALAGRLGGSQLPAGLAPACGLTLVHVSYP